MRISVNPESAVPLHVQLLNQMRHLILSGEWTPGRRLPSEAELQRDLQISRGTIRKALKNAEVEGLIERVPSKGTFVAHPQLRDTPSRIIGYITSDFLSDFQRQVLRGAEEAARAKGYRLLFSSSSQDVNTENQLLQQMLQDRVSGIMIWPVFEEALPRLLLELGERSEPPLVLMDRTLRGLACDSVASNNYAGAFAATEHLIQLGHERIVFMTRPLLQLSTIAARLRGYEDALRDAGKTPPEPWIIGGEDQRQGEHYTLSLYNGGITGLETNEIAERLRQPQRPTAILAMNDLTALLVLKAATQADLSVPQDLSLVGFDDLYFLTFLPVPLTTVAQDTHGLGRRAAGLLIERIEGYTGPPRSELLPTRLVVRASTAKPSDLSSGEFSPSSQ